MFTSDLLSGAIAEEYGDMLLAANKEENPTETCGSDCSGGECEDQTCLPPEEQKEQAQKKKYKAFVPALAGWNEPPALN